MARISPAVCLGILLPLFEFGCAGPAGSAGETTATNHRSAKSGQSPATLLVTSAKSVELGIVPQAGREQETFSISNAGSNVVEIAKVETSCDCLDVELSRRIAKPGEKLLGVVKLDLAKEPGFTGNLAIEVKGLAKTGELAFSVSVLVTIRPPAEFERTRTEDSP